MPELAFIADSSVDHLRLALNVGRIGVWELNLSSGKAWRNRLHDRIFGYDELLPEWSYDRFLEHVVPEERERVDELRRNAIARGEEWSFDCRIVRADGVPRWISAAGAPLHDEDGNVVKLIGHVVDITTTKENEDRLHLLSSELNHRVRNMFALIKAMIRLAARQSNEVPEFSEGLSGRVSALGRAHELISSETREAIAPADIALRELEAYPEFKQRMVFDVRSEAVLSPTMVQRFALVVHELMTNAIKYGAFSNETGTVRFDVSDTDDGRVEVRWSEQGGPSFDTGSEAGFGTKLITSALGADGTVELGFGPEGRVCLIRMTR